MDKILYKYTNGNTEVTILNDGTKIREYEDIPVIEHPESIDVKITNACDLGCAYCHENSTKNGKHADLKRLKIILNDLPSGVELAIGGGNPVCHPDLYDFLMWCRYEKGFICNITINQKHLSQYNDLIIKLLENDLIKGIGISICDVNDPILESICKLSKNVVFHVITGVNKIIDLDNLIKIPHCKILILGYKVFGRGVNYFNDSIKSEIDNWYKNLHKYLGKCILSFDNLALEQLEVKRLLTKKAWSNFYMGDDFTFTMYIDAVKQEFAPTSRSSKRKSFHEFTLINYFITERETK